MQTINRSMRHWNSLSIWWLPVNRRTGLRDREGGRKSFRRTETESLPLPERWCEAFHSDPGRQLVTALDFATDAKLRKALGTLKIHQRYLSYRREPLLSSKRIKFWYWMTDSLWGWKPRRTARNCSVYKEIYDSQFKKPGETKTQKEEVR